MLVSNGLLLAILEKSATASKISNKFYTMLQCGRNMFKLVLFPRVLMIKQYDWIE